MPDSNSGPYASFNFLVEFDGVAVAAFSEVSGLDFEIEPIEYRDGNERQDSVRKIPGLRKYGNITLKRGVTGNDDFWAWIVQALEGPVEKRNGRIVLLDERREPVVYWQFGNGWPCKYTGPDLNATANEIAIETIEICHEGLELSAE